MSEPALLDADLADQYRRIYRAQFREDVEAGNKIPFLIHLCFWGIFIIPILYLSIPHKRRPWLYNARWLVLAVCTALNFWVARNVSSVNFAFAYGSGLCAAWGVVWNLTMLVWTKPQWNAMRVERYPNPRFGKAIPREERESVKDDAASTSFTGAHGQTFNGYAGARLRESRRSGNDKPVERLTNGEAQGNHEILKHVSGLPEKADCNKHDDSAVDLRELNRQQQFIYKWQEFPEDAPFLTRLDWAFDIATTMRLTGWNWAIHVLPPYRPPPWFDGNTYQLPLQFLDNRSRLGYSRVLTRREFFLGRLISIILCYIIIDMCATIMTQDPYFILGPNDLPLPPELDIMNSFMLSLRRSSLSFLAIIVALHFAWDFGAVLIALLGPPVMGFRAHPWHLPSMTGSFMQVLDRGLSGFWGVWWHQTFRFGFSAPTKWMIRSGYIKEKSPAAAVVGALVAFVTSGFLHGMGSYTTVPQTKFWEPPIFFFLSGIGTSLQSMLSKKLKTRIEKMPQWVRRVGNLVFVLFWLHISCWFLLDDFGRCGIWLWEPVPFSLMRWLGYGIKGDYWWRWRKDDNLTWIVGKHWWDSGVGI